jgi:hypothetical protein
MGLDFLISYIALGVLVNFMYDLIVSKLGEEHEKNRFTMIERVTVTIIWPIIVFNFIKGILNTNKND